MTFYPNAGGARSPHGVRRRASAREVFIALRGASDAAQRQREIDALPTVAWKGRTLKTLRCHGTTGKGPHDTNVPESLLWSLIDLRGYCCVYHPRELQADTTGGGR